MRVRCDSSEKQFVSFTLDPDFGSGSFQLYLGDKEFADSFKAGEEYDFELNPVGPVQTANPKPSQGKGSPL